MKMKSRTVAKRGFNLDFMMWMFTRLSALTLYLLGLVGVTAALVMGARNEMDVSTLVRWTFFPNPSHVVSSDVVNIDAYINYFWQIMQILVVFFGVTHGINGLRIIVEDYIGSNWWRPIWRGFIFFLWLFILLVAIYVILGS